MTAIDFRGSRTLVVGRGRRGKGTSFSRLPFYAHLSIRHKSTDS